MAVSIEERRALVSERVTLDGKPAVIMGIQNDYATIAQLPNGASYQWAWETVARIVSRGGDFRG